MGGNIYVKGVLLGSGTGSGSSTIISGTTTVVSYSGIQSFNNTTPVNVPSSSLTLVSLGTASRDTTQSGMYLTYDSVGQFYKNQSGNTLSCSLSFTFQWNPNASGSRVIFITHNELGTITTASTQAIRNHHTNLFYCCNH